MPRPTPIASDSAPNRRDAGFTFIELTVVIIILMIIASAVIPVFSGALSNARARRGVMDVAAMMRHAGEMAVLQTAEFRLFFNEGARTFWLMQAVRNQGKVVFVRLEGAAGEPKRFPEGFTLSLTGGRDGGEDGQSRYIRFLPTGACDDAAISLTSERNLQWRVKLEGFYNRVTVEDAAS